MRSPRRLAGPQTGKSEITDLLPGRTTSPSTPLTCIFSQRSHQNSKAAIKRGVPVDSEALTATATATRGAARGQPAGTGPGPSKPACLRPRHREGRAALEGGLCSQRCRRQPPPDRACRPVANTANPPFALRLPPGLGPRPELPLRSRRSPGSTSAPAPGGFSFQRAERSI